MKTESLFRSKISGTGYYLPEKILSNFDLEKMVDTSDQWIRERTGIERRHLASPEQATSDLAVIASQNALNDAGLTSQDIDMIIVATASPDQVMPSTACLLQDKLGCRNIMGFDLSAACSGFVYALSVADQFVRTGFHKHVLVVGAEVLHRFVNYKDRETCILFGDGAGAWIISQAGPNETNVILSSHLRTDGNLGDLFVLPAGGTRLPFSQEVLEQGLHYVRMKGREIFKHAVRTMTLVCQQALEANNHTSDQVDWVIPHQANARILQSVAEHFNIPMEKVLMYMHETGNTSAASIPIAFELARQEGKVKRGQTILLTAFGAGITSGSLLMRY